MFVGLPSLNKNFQNYRKFTLNTLTKTNVILMMWLANEIDLYRPRFLSYQ